MEYWNELRWVFPSLVKKSEKNRGLIKRVENGGILSIICHDDGVLEHIGENRWQLCHQVPLIFFAIVFQY